jgi:hypothetical protein
MNISFSGHGCHVIVNSVDAIEARVLYTDSRPETRSPEHDLISNYNSPDNKQRDVSFR